MKRKDKYLVGHLGSLNPVYGLEHYSNCQRYECPMTFPTAKRMRKEINKNSPSKAVIFKLVVVKP